MIWVVGEMRAFFGLSVAVAVLVTNAPLAPQFTRA